MNRARLWIFGRWVLSIFGALSVVYCLAVLGFVATAPDLGLRCLLVSDDNGRSEPLQKGLQIRQIAIDPDQILGEVPRPGDRLDSIRDLSAHTFIHFAARLLDLRNAELPG